MWREAKLEGLVERLFPKGQGRVARLARRRLLVVRHRMHQVTPSEGGEGTSTMNQQL